MSEDFEAEKQKDDHDEDFNSVGEESFGSDETAKLDSDQPRGMLLLAARHVCQGQPCSMYMGNN